MLKMFKSNILLIVSFLILLSIIIFQANSFIKNDERLSKKNDEQIQLCKNGNYENANHEEYCKNLLANENKMDSSVYTMYVDIAIFGINQLYITLFLFISVPSLIYICKYLKNKKILDDITRSNYKKIKTKLFTNAYKSAFILPIIIIVAFLICYLYTKNSDTSMAIKNGIWSADTLSNPIIFFVAYLFNIVVHSFLYVNICLCIARKHHNYFVAVILSFLTFIGIEAFLEIFINNLLFTFILKSDLGIVFNIANMIAFNDSSGILPAIIVPLTITIISFIILHYLYKDKEALVISCEQNE